MDKKTIPTKLTTLVANTLELRVLLLQSLDDVVHKRITPSDARARSWLARSILDTMRVEMIAAREGLIEYQPVKLFPEGKIIDGDVSK